MTVPTGISVEVLKQVSSLLRRLTPEDIENLIAGRARLTCEEIPRKGAIRKTTAPDIPDPEEVKAALSALDSREEGLAYLEELGLNRQKLRLLASAFDLPVPRSDTVERIKDRLVEATIGYRISSEAIRGSGANGRHLSGD
ncbi:hypothetical protein ACFCYB_06180 [Streptomyces sp. NPDC056309]|uniref:hypothetical protein n=1 Tax=Streptomyces sp. NPDC056309 TaxID=3345781 RepID=UPI0035E1C74D